MGRERASKVRQRERGEICALCGILLAPLGVPPAAPMRAPAQNPPRGPAAPGILPPGSGLGSRPPVLVDHAPGSRPQSRERVCDACSPNAPRHHILMTFFVRGTPAGQQWCVSFLEADCETPVGHRRTYPDDTAIRTIARRGRCLFITEPTLTIHLEGLLNHGRGTLWLYLTRAQYLRLRSRQR